MKRRTPKEIREILRQHAAKQKGCEGKQKYLDEYSARSRASRDKGLYRGKRKKAEGAHRPYRCQFCTYWHIGTISNPSFRTDFQELTNKAKDLWYGIIPFAPWRDRERPDLSALFERGLVKKEELAHGEYYIGYTKKAVVARWHETDGLFYYQAWILKAGGEDERKTIGSPHPSDDAGSDIFVPVDKTRPTRNQSVYEPFGEACPVER